MKRLLLIACLALTLSRSGAHAQEDFYLGEIRLFGFPWCPVGWVMANGGSLDIQQNQALYALLGTRFGGGGGQFNLPDARRDRVIIPESMAWCIATAGATPSPSR